MAVPSPQTFEAIKDNILRFLKLKDDTEADTLAGLGIRSGLVRLAAYPLKSMTETTELTLTTGSHKLTLPTDFNMAMSLHFLDTSDKRAGRIIYRREEDFDAILDNEEGVSAVPSIYCIRGNSGQLEFDRTPTTELISAKPKVRLRYFKRVDNLVTSTSTFNITPEVEEFLTWFGRQQLAPIYDAKMFPLAQSEAARALRDLIRRDTVIDEGDWF